jgi:hypothetical protein
MKSEITLKPNDALAPLALFGMLLVGDRAIAVSSISVVEMIEKQIRIELTSGNSFDLDPVESEAFTRQLQDLLRQAQFGGGVPPIKRG